MTPLEARRVQFENYEYETCKPFQFRRSCSRYRFQEEASKKIIHAKHENDTIRRESSFLKIRSEAITNLKH